MVDVGGAAQSRKQLVGEHALAQHVPLVGLRVVARRDDRAHVRKAGQRRADEQRAGLSRGYRNRRRRGITRPDHRFRVARVDEKMNVVSRELAEDLVVKERVRDTAIEQRQRRSLTFLDRAVTAEEDVDDVAVTLRVARFDAAGERGDGVPYVLQGRRPRRRGELRVAALGLGVHQREQVRAVAAAGEKLVERNGVVVGEMQQRQGGLRRGSLLFGEGLVVPDDEQVNFVVGAGDGSLACKRGGHQHQVERVARRPHGTTSKSSVERLRIMSGAAMSTWRRSSG